MGILLNSRQADGLANFFFDVGKGVVLGSLGFSAVISKMPFPLRLLNVLGGLALAYICIKMALRILEEP